MKLIIDRFEGDFAVVELPNKTLLDIQKCILPSDSLEGDVISIEIDRGETAKRLTNIKLLGNELWKK